MIRAGKRASRSCLQEAKVLKTTCFFAAFRVFIKMAIGAATRHHTNIKQDLQVVLGTGFFGFAFANHVG